MIENENQWLPGGDPLASLDDARGIVEADQRLSQPSKERRNPPAHAKIIRRMAGGLPSRLETPAGTRIPGPIGDHHQAQTAIPTSRHTASSQEVAAVFVGQRAGIHHDPRAFPRRGARAAAPVDVVLVDAPRGRDRGLPAGPYQPLAAGDPVARLPGCQPDARRRTVREVPATGRVRIARARGRLHRPGRDTAEAEGRGEDRAALRGRARLRWFARGHPDALVSVRGARHLRFQAVRRSGRPRPADEILAITGARPRRAPAGLAAALVQRAAPGAENLGAVELGTTDRAPAAAARSGSGRYGTTAAARCRSWRHHPRRPLRSQPRPTRRRSIPEVFRRRAARDRCTPERSPPRSRSRWQRPMQWLWSAWRRRLQASCKL